MRACVREGMGDLDVCDLAEKGCVVVVVVE